MSSKTQKRRGPKVKVAADDKLIPGSIRLSQEQWGKFIAWGGAAKLRGILNLSRVKAA